MFDQNYRSLLDSQIRYYDARASEYDASLGYEGRRFTSKSPDFESMELIRKIVRVLPAVNTTLELACGTGIWTRELLRTSASVHGVDSSLTMISINRAACRRRASYECADLFDWEPKRRFDRVAAAFWLSHVPDEMLVDFGRTMVRSVGPQGQILIIDELATDSSDTPQQVIRELIDGRQFPIVKAYRDVQQLCDVFEPLGCRPVLDIVSSPLFALVLHAK